MRVAWQAAHLVAGAYITVVTMKMLVLHAQVSNLVFCGVTRGIDSKIGLLHIDASSTNLS